MVTDIEAVGGGVDDPAPNVTFTVLNKCSTNNVKSAFSLPADSTLSELYKFAGNTVGFVYDTFDLVYRENTLDLFAEADTALSGLGFMGKATLVLEAKGGGSGSPTPVVQNVSEDTEMTALGTSPRGVTTPAYRAPRYQPAWSNTMYNVHDDKRGQSGFVGLSNQGATCYLNSLLQSLYMTPEFRNALYNWESPTLSDADKPSCIPYQLQRLFAILQTAEKRAVETTELTKSFGWDATEAFQQHDVQELCRVLFDALENEFQNTEQANLIDNLYQGSMKDYVQCKECLFESDRSDTFLDVPLNIRSFGSDKAVGSVAEALEKFLEPEVLDGSNQYRCEKCDKKVDALKGLKFSKFPYLLTLQLKRFDFDYSTMRRIKLNDRVTFPQKLTLDPFIAGTGEIAKKASTRRTELGAPSPRINPTKAGTSSVQPSEMLLDSLPKPEELSKPDASGDTLMTDANEETTAPSTPEVGDIDGDRAMPGVEEGDVEGDHQYELFSIMIHSGSSHGGHYYAYIKDMDSGVWHNFNDSNVNEISPDEIESTYGGGGFYQRSANAYMLMYRKIDPALNQRFLTGDRVPAYIKQILEQEKVEAKKKAEEEERRRHEVELSVYKYSAAQADGAGPDATPTYPEEKTTRVDSRWSLNKVLGVAAELFGIAVVDPALLRLRRYKCNLDLAEETFTGRGEETLAHLRISHYAQLLLEERSADDLPFADYCKTDIHMKIHPISQRSRDEATCPLEQKLFLPPTRIVIDGGGTLDDLKWLVAKRLHVDAGKVVLMKWRVKGIDNVLYSQARAELLEDPCPADPLSLHAGHRLSDGDDLYLDTPLSVPEDFKELKLHTAMETSRNEITISVTMYASADTTSAEVAVTEGPGDGQKKDGEDPRPKAFEKTIFADNRWTLFNLKERLSPLLGLGPNEFKLLKNSSGLTHNIELTSLETSLQRNGLFTKTKLVAEPGRAMRVGEQSVKFRLFRPMSAEPMEVDPIFSLYLPKSDTIRSVRAVVASKLNEPEHFQTLKDDWDEEGPIPETHVRLRELQYYGRPREICVEEQILSDIVTYNEQALLVQILTSPEIKSSKDQMILSVQLWDPATMELGARTEVVSATNATIGDLKHTLAADFSLEANDIGLAKPSDICGRDLSPFDVLKLRWDESPVVPYVLPPPPSANRVSSSDADSDEAKPAADETESDQPSTDCALLRSSPLYLEEGMFLLLRDNTVATKDLTKEERAAMKESAEKRKRAVASTSTRRAGTSSASVYVPRKERGLKIASSKRHGTEEKASVSPPPTD